MKNTSKRILIAILCLVLAFSAVFALAACNNKKKSKGLSDSEKEQLKTELIGSVNSVTLSQGTAVGTIGMAGAQTEVYAVWNGDEEAMSADLVMVGAGNNPTAKAMLIRGDDVFMWEGTVSVSGNNKPQQVLAMLNVNQPQYEQTTLEEVMAQLQGDSDVGDMGDVEIEDIGDISDIIDAKLIFSMVTTLFTDVSEDSNGYIISANLSKAFETIWNSVYTMATKLDEGQNKTLSAVYNDAEFKEAFNALFGNVDGETVQALLEMAIEQSGEEFPIEILQANKGESAYNYIGRYLNIKIIGNLKAGDATVAQIRALLEIDGDLTDQLDEFMDAQTVAMVKTMLQQFKLELHFSYSKNLIGLHMELEGMAVVDVKPATNVSLVKITK